MAILSTFGAMTARGFGWLFQATGGAAGALYSWGAGSVGRLGLNDTVNRSSPTQVGALTTWSRASCGALQAVVIKTDGTLWAWGYNPNGQLGLGDTVDRSSPVQVGALTTWSKLNASKGNSSLAIKTDGTICVWGLNNQGQLGLGDLVSRSSPVQVGALTTWSSATGGGDHTLAIKTDGTLWAWGSNDRGCLGDGTATLRSTPVQIGALTTWTSIDAGSALSLATKS